MKIHEYESLSSQEFEHLVITICQEILGIGSLVFSTGPDGGKDSYFEGKAIAFPSTNEPWSGKFVIQAKHTQKINASCSDRDFYKNKNSVLEREISKLIKLKSSHVFDNYILFTNRKLPAIANDHIVDELKKRLEIDNVCIIGRETLDSYLHSHPGVFKLFNIKVKNNFLPLDDNEIKNVILHYCNENNDYEEVELDSSGFELVSINYEKKNKINNMSKDYFEHIVNTSISHVTTIKLFLENPQNKEYLKMYQRTVIDLRGKLANTSPNYLYFNLALQELIERTQDTHKLELYHLRNYVVIFYHYMYLNCDIGKKYYA